MIFNREQLGGRLATLAARGVHIGTSSWKYTGWCGSLYDTELVTDQVELLQEVVDDFWRRKFFIKPAPLLGYALANGFTTDYLMSFLQEMLGNSKLKILPDFDLGKIHLFEEECLTLFFTVRKMWLDSHEEIRSLIQNDKGLSRAKDKYHLELLPSLFEAMDRYARSNNPYDVFNSFRKLCSSGLLNGKKPTGAPLAHPFFNLCEDLLQRIDKRFLALRAELLAFAAEKLPVRKRERNIRFFDDLLTCLFDA
ncbi:MAG: hypothetical protein WCR20_14840, partial [Verrucomicrobiota bacterium]